MRIPRIFVELPLQGDHCITLDDRANRHVTKVLRLRSGAKLIVFDGSGVEFEATIEDIKRSQTTVRVGLKKHADVESPLQIILAQGISRGERMDYTLQKAVELGVHGIAPLWTEHTQVRLQNERLEKRLAHWRGVVIHACQQSGRLCVPDIAPPMEFGIWLRKSSDQISRVLLDPTAANTIADLEIQDSRVVLLAGPEGGLSGKERLSACNNGFIPVRLGPRILRTETAALAAISSLQTLWGDFR